MSQVHELATNANGAVKNALEARNHLFTKGWVAPGETIALETLARVLFATIVNTQKMPQAASTNIAAVAHLLTERLETGIMEDMANHISIHIKDTLDSLTSDMHVKLGQHIQTANETAQSQIALTEKLIQAQEKLEETTQKAITSTKSYSQVAASAPTMLAPTPAPPISLDRVRLLNREEIKKRQVLIDFNRTQELQLENMTETVLARKANDAIKTAWAIIPDPKPEIPKIKAAILMRNGGLLLELNSNEAAEWLRNGTNRENFLNNIGSGACIKDRTYQVIVSFVPTSFKPDDADSLRAYETINDLQPDTVLKAEWIKPVTERREGQRVATARFYHKDAKSANVILSKGAFILGRKVLPKKPRKEPIRCLKCQLFGHEGRHCTSPNARCAKCARTHDTDQCLTPPRTFFCCNCEGRHASYDRDCPTFLEKCAQQDERCPENNLAFYPTDESWTWVTVNSYANHDTQPREQTEWHSKNQYANRVDIWHEVQHRRRANSWRRNTGEQRLSGANATPIGHLPPTGQQPHPDLSQ